MKKHMGIIITAVLFLAVTIGANLPVIGVTNAGACGSGRSAGGGDYTPQRRGSAGYQAEQNALTVEQARDLVAYHVQKLNPDLTIGNVNDAGGFYEAEILSKDQEVLQLLGVDKFSGRVLMIN
jgi:hypothetical protein